MTARITLVPASIDRLPAFREALTRDWSPDNVRGAEAAAEMLAAVDRDPDGFVAQQEDWEARGDPIRLPDGTTVPRLPGVIRWIWDGAFCGTLGLRWQPGTDDLPPHVLGHVGFAVVPWKRGRGYAAEAVRAILPVAREAGLTHIELTIDPANLPSRRAIKRAGGLLVEEFTKPAAYGGGPALRFRIATGLRQTPNSG